MGGMPGSLRSSVKLRLSMRHTSGCRQLAVKSLIEAVKAILIFDKFLSFLQISLRAKVLA